MLARTRSRSRSSSSAATCRSASSTPATARGLAEHHPRQDRGGRASGAATPATLPAPHSVRRAVVWTTKPNDPAAQAGGPRRRPTAHAIEVTETDLGPGHRRPGRQPVHKARQVGRQAASGSRSPSRPASRSTELRLGQLGGSLPSHWASRPPTDTARSRCSVASRCLRGVTTSTSSPCRRTVRRSGTSVFAVPHDERDRRAGRQPELADLDAVHQRLRRDRHLQQVGRDPLERGRLDVEVPRLAAPGDLEHLGRPRQRRPGQQGVDHDDARTRCRRAASAPSTSSASGMVASTIGTAPRSPAQERKASSRQGIGWTSDSHERPRSAGRAGSARARPRSRSRRSRGRCVTRRDQQPEHHEQPDLGQPGHALGERPGGRPVGQLGVAEDQRGDVHRTRSRNRAGRRSRRTRAP